MANIFELPSKDRNITPEKTCKSRQMQFSDKTAYVWGLHYWWDPWLSTSPTRRLAHFMPPWSLVLFFVPLLVPSVLVCICLYLCVSACACVYICAYLYVFVCLCVSVYMFVYVSVGVFQCVSLTVWYHVYSIASNWRASSVTSSPPESESCQIRNLFFTKSFVKFFHLHQQRCF